MARAFVLINTETGSEQKVVNLIRLMKNVKETYAVFGVYDAIAFIEAEKIEDLKNIVFYELRKINDVRSTVTMIVAEGKETEKALT